MNDLSIASQIQIAPGARWGVRPTLRNTDLADESEGIKERKDMVKKR